MTLPVNLGISVSLWILVAIASTQLVVHGFSQVPRSTCPILVPAGSTWLSASAVKNNENEGQSSSPSSFSSSSTSSTTINHVMLEYCTNCKFLTRSIWMAQELLTTFNDAPLSAVTLTPSRPPAPNGKFVVTLYQTTTTTTQDADIMEDDTSSDDKSSSLLLWDRQAQQGFPEVKELKQLVRDQIDPSRFLGHSDNPQGPVTDASIGDAGEEMAVGSVVVAMIQNQIRQKLHHHHHVAIQYCTGCRWMLRSTYLATELLTTFANEMDSLTLVPSRPPEKGGMFIVTINNNMCLSITFCSL